VKFNIYFKRFMILIICLLYISFLTIDIFPWDSNLASNYFNSNLLKFLSILLCFITSLIAYPIDNQPRNIFLLQLGLLFTVMADYIFLIYDADYQLAIGLFSIVQIIYSLRYRRGEELKRLLKYLSIFFIVLISFRIGRMFCPLDFLIFMGIFYLICFLISLKDAIKLNKILQEDVSRRIVSGMVLFFLCDLSLGLNYLLTEGYFNGILVDKIKDLASLSVWIFYLPSQLLLSLSGYI